MQTEISGKYNSPFYFCLRSLFFLSLILTISIFCSKNCKREYLSSKVALALFSLVFAPSRSLDKVDLERASATRACVKITPREKRRHAARVIFTRARVSLALLSLRKNGGLLVVYRQAHRQALDFLKVPRFSFPVPVVGPSSRSLAGFCRREQKREHERTYRSRFFQLRS